MHSEVESQLRCRQLIEQKVGRVRYDSSPNPTTLDALARFLDYPDWRSFSQATPAQSIIQPIEHATPPTSSSAGAIPSANPRPRSGLVWGAGLLMGIALAWGLAFSLRKPATAPSYAFRSRVVTKGLPNSVIFTYDARQAPTDCVAIQQSWDARRRFAVDKNQQQVSSQYYVPGFYRAKLVVDGQEVLQHPLLIQTDGWLPMIERSPVPVYFTPQQARQPGRLGLTPAQIRAVNIPLQPTPPWVSYYWVGDWRQVPSSDFTFETELRNDYAEGSGACQRTEMVLLCQDNAFVIPLARPGCVSGLRLHLADRDIAGTNADLSAFGVGFLSDNRGGWVRLRCEAKQKTVRIYINEQLAYTTSFTKEAGALVGLHYRFEGTGSVRSARLTDGAGRVIFREVF
jgi:hypothetical protein